jgi:hypothetical protein
MKIKITNTADGLKLAKCLIGSKLVGFDEDRILVGVDGRYQYPFYVTDLCQYDEITIDLSNAEMDLRLAIGTDIEFVMPSGKVTKIIGYQNGYAISEYVEEYGDSVILENPRLSKDYLEQIGVEIQENE